MALQPTPSTPIRKHMKPPIHRIDVKREVVIGSDRMPAHQIPYGNGTPLTRKDTALVFSGDFDVFLVGSGAEREIVLFDH